MNFFSLFKKSFLQNFEKQKEISVDYISTELGGWCDQYHQMYEVRDTETVPAECAVWQGAGVLEADKPN